MKRKPSQELVGTHVRKKVINNCVKNNSSKPCRLLQVLAQYGLLVAIASNLFPQDLYALAATSKSTYKAIFPSEESRNNLLSKMNCAGLGVAIRIANHRKSIYFSQYQCTEYLQCGTRNVTQTIESRPCVCCGKVTCDECRIHCVYGSIQQLPDDSDELPEFSGFALLSAPEMRILTPAHLPANGEDEIDDIVHTTPFHDSGFLDAPLDCATYVEKQPVDSILDFDLGLGPLQLSDSPTKPHPSPVIQAFWDISEGRKRWICMGCNSRKHKCSCTFRKHLVDRWLCLPCYQKEQQGIRTSENRVNACHYCYANFNNNRYCRNKKFGPKLTCLWCKGAVEDSTRTWTQTKDIGAPPARTK